jgi:nucleoid-associated protein YgaU
MRSRLALPRIVAVLALIVALAGAMDLLAASTAQAQDNYKTIPRLGGGNRFDPPLKDRASVQKWVAKKRTQQALAAIFEKAGLSSLNATVIDILTTASPDQLKDIQFEPGGTMVWMAFRRGGGKPDIVRNVRWGGKKPFPGYTFVIDDLNQTYTFVLPHPCANLALVSSEPSREKARLDAEKAAADKAAADKAAAEKAAADRARLEAERRERERAEAERLARDKAAAEKAAADRAAAEKAAADKAEAERLAAEKKAKIDWFVSGLFGKERRTREVDATSGSTTVKVNESLCAPLLGVKFGPEIKVNPNFKINPAVGFAANFEKGDYSSMFAEAEFNYYSTGLKNYVGASVGMWDFTHSDWVTPSVGIQFGSQVWTNAKEDKLYIVAEGRMFTRTFGEGLSNNYQFWGGLRYVIR